ncbi:restriction endonuclease subunit S [Vibrio cholerae]|uniref:restriction endonuclease subunit S n=1 Tax=Vibrio cholerae TaxID=666 RepID=UPI0018F1024F|nr:restriction endonuclease subunit S [Vibrio cholerae]EGQ9106553.1 restriction endonuclease subunit S [Vibrio cholerae]ELH0878180.1 restriction endonuclease subunit S [Vibrio cholerae]MBJ6955409.1 restriction endonuclease subunit S [Vibrio cholerae]MBJ6959858.1 restriction endonuclease subunit S [Vibrio cholerae]MBY4645486.1 restriction endonuclease subunit S [Vibrio cholerae]
MSSNWSRYRLEELGDIVTGKTPPSKVQNAFSDSGTQFVTPRDMDGRRWIDSTERFLSESGVAAVKNSLVPSGSVAVSCIGSDMGKAVLLKVESVTNQQINTLVVDTQKFNPKFVYYVLSTKQDEFKSIAGGSATPILNKGHFGKFEIDLPTKDEQDFLVRCLDSLDSKIENNTQTNQTLEQIAQAIFKSWFVDFDPVKAKIETLATGGSTDDAELAAMGVISAKTVDELNSLKTSNPEAFNKLAQTAALFPAAMQDSELGEIPEGWDNGIIEDVMQFSSERVDVSGLNLRNYISTENMLENKRGITTASSLPSVSSVPAFNENEILISNIRPYFKKIWLTEFKGGRSPDVLGFSLLDPEETEFAYNLLYQDRFFEYMMTTSKGAKMPRGDKSAIKQFSFPLPQKELRLVFSKHVRPFYPMIKNTNKESEHLHALRDALLPELLSGNLGRS